MRKQLLIAIIGLCQLLLFPIDQAPARPATSVIPAHNGPDYLLSQNPQFPGGEQALFRFMQEHLQYPLKAREKGIEGMVEVSFIVQPSGKVVSPEIISGLGHGCDEEVLRVIRQMPNWLPGIQNDIKVAAKIILPISFRLEF